MSDPDWRESINKLNLKRDDTTLPLGLLNTDTILYRGDLDSYKADSAVTGQPYKRTITWFSNRPVAEIYGPARQFVLTRPACFLRMDEPEVIEWLLDKFKNNPNVQSALKNTFPIMKKEGFGGSYTSWVERESDPIQDVIVANALCNLVNGIENNCLAGWMHTEMNEVGSGGNIKFEPEIMFCNTAQFLKYGNNVMYDDETILFNLKSKALKNKSEASNKRSYITFGKGSTQIESREYSSPQRKKQKTKLFNEPEVKPKKLAF